MHNNFFQLEDIINKNVEEIKIMGFDFNKIEPLLIKIDIEATTGDSLGECRTYYTIKVDSVVGMINVLNKSILLNEAVLSLNDFYEEIEGGLIEEIFINSLIKNTLIRQERNLLKIDIDVLNNAINNLNKFIIK